MEDDDLGDQGLVLLTGSQRATGSRCASSVRCLKFSFCYRSSSLYVSVLLAASTFACRYSSLLPTCPADPRHGLGAVGEASEIFPIYSFHLQILLLFCVWANLFMGRAVAAATCGFSQVNMLHLSFPFRFLIN